MSLSPEEKMERTEQRIAELVRLLDETEQELQRLTGGQIDAVTAAGARPILLRDAQEKLRASELAQRKAAETQTAILNALPAHIALLDAAGGIVAVNESWRRFALANSLQSPAFAVGSNYLEVCERARGEWAAEAPAVAEGIREVLQGRQAEFSLEYPCHSPSEARWFQMTATPYASGGESGAVVIHHNITSRKLVEDALRVSEANMAAAQRIGHFGSWVMELADDGDMDASPLHWSDEAYRIAGYEPGGVEVSTRLFFGLVPPEEHAAVQEALMSSFHDGQPYSVVHRIIRPNGEVRTVQETAQIFFDPQTGRPARMIGTAHDVTERTRAEAEARRSMESLEEIGRIQREIANAEGGLEALMALMAERAQALSRAGGATVEIVEGDEMVYRAGSGLLAAHVGFRLAVRRSLSGHTVALGVLQRCDDAETDPHVDLAACRRLGVRSMLVAPLHAGDQVLGVLKVVSAEPRFFSARDATNLQILAETLGHALERQRAADALRASEQEFRTLAEAMPQIVWTAGTDGSGLYFNRQWTEYTGLALAASLGQHWIECAHLEDRAGAWDLWQEALAAQAPYAAEIRLRRADGQYRWWLARGEPQRDAAGQVRKWFGTFTDIHDLKLAGQEIVRSNRALKMLSACNQALNHVEGEVELLQKICELVVAIGDYRMAWVGYAREDAPRSIQPMACAGEESGYLAEAKLSWSEETPRGRGPGGRTIRTGEAAICVDLEKDSMFFWSAEARQRGYRGIVCLPLRDGAHTFGLLALYSAQAVEAGADELRLLQELADNLAFGILAGRARAERRRLQEAVLAIARGVSASGGREFFGRLMQHLVTALHAAVGFVSLVSAGERRSARTLAAVIDGELVENFDFDLAGTPCEIPSRGEVCLVERAVHRYVAVPRLAALGLESYAGIPLTNSAGEVIGAMGVLFREAITQPDFILSTLEIFAARSGAEMERQRSDAQVREQAALLDKAQDSISVRDLANRVTYWNKSAERLFGWTAEEARGRHVLDLLQVDPEVWQASMNAVSVRGEWSGEMGASGRNGQRLTLLCRWTLVRDADGVPTSILAIDTDITERKKLEEQFFRAQRMESIGTLAGGIAHDLNNALNPVLVSLEILQMKFTDPESQELLGIIRDSAQRGADMVRQVLSFARGVEGQRLNVDVKRIVREVTKIASDTFFKNIEVRTAVPPDLWTILGDPTQLHQVLLNLCVNARDAMPHGGRLTVTAENRTIDEHYAGLNTDAAPGRYVFLQVADTGCGIPPDNLEKIFDPFFTTKELGKGTGLGLSTAIAIVKSHGGFMRAYSELGKGTKFKIYLPAQADDAVEPAEATPEIPRGRGELIMVVDDETSVRGITQRTLEAFGYRTVPARDGADAVAIYAARGAEIAVVVTDMMMPVMDGPAAIAILRSMNPAVRVIGASGLSNSGLVTQAANLGVKIFLPKPYTAQMLLTALSQVLAEK